MLETFNKPTKAILFTQRDKRRVDINAVEK